MRNPTVSELLSNAMDSMSSIQGRIHFLRSSFAAYLLDNSSNVSVDYSPTSTYSPVSSDATAPTEHEALPNCHGLQSAVAQFKSQGISSERIFVVRKVHCLVTNAADILKSYFSRFGRVTHVELLPSRRRCGRLRPSTTGFVILESPAAVALVLKNHSSVHQVTAEHEVEVTPFTYPVSSCAAVPDTFYDN